MSEPMRQERRREPWRGRLTLVSVMFAVVFVSVGLRLVDLATREPLQGSTWRESSEAPDARRASILDRRGELLAANIATLSVVADPAKVIDTRATATALTSALEGIDGADLLRRLERGGRFAWVKRHISPREQMAVQALGLPGVAFRDSEMRVYPKGRLVSHVLGFVDVDNQGLTGIEYGLQDALVGGAEAGNEPVALALDIRVQEAARRTLLSAVKEYRALGGCAIVLDARSRELLSLVSLPDFDPNHPQLAPADARTNRCTGNVHELGSMLKIVTTAMALESGEVKLTDRFDASKPLTVNGHKIRDDHGKWRMLTVPEVFAFSSNIGTVQMAFEAGGAAAQKPFLEALGLTEKPVLAIPETQKPILPAKWPPITSATVSYGHGIAVSPLQFAEAATALLVDGRLKRTAFLRRDDAGPSEPSAEDDPVIVSESTIRDLRWLSWLTVQHGTGTHARTAGYLMGGKTGTADKPSADRRGYRRGAVIASFFGAFPIHDPRYLVLVVLDEPQGNEATFGYRYGGWTAAPVVAEIARRTGPLLGVAPTSGEVSRALEQRLRVVPAVNGRTHREEEGFEAVVLAR